MHIACPTHHNKCGFIQWWPRPDGWEINSRITRKGRDIMGFLDHIAEPGIRTVYDYWLEKRQGSMVPRKRNINPAELPPHLLPWLFIYRRDRAERYRCVLSGTGLALIDGRDATNRYLDEVEPADAADKLGQLFTRTLEEGLPLYFSGRRDRFHGGESCLAQLLLRNRIPGETSHGHAEQGCSTLLLPISGNRRPNNHILGVVMFHEAARQGAGEALSRGDWPGSVVQATPEDLLRREPDTQVA